MGAALTTGIAFGVAGWWMTNRVEFVSFLRAATVNAAKITKTALTEAGLLDSTKRAIQTVSEAGSGGASDGPAQSDQSVLTQTVKKMAAAARLATDFAGETGSEDAGNGGIPSSDHMLLKETVQKMEEMHKRMSQLESRLTKANI